MGYFNPDEHLVSKGGKRFINFTGLLAKVADDGKEIIESDSELIQVPDDSNGNVAILKAKFVVRFEGETEPRTFRAHGDASPDNVGTMVASALIRMAETRAWVRALRLIMRSVTAAEELPDSAVAAEEDVL